jgi:riboflavin biosynthesis pyrimidine reductase
VKKKTERPYVICHNITSVDGKIKPTLWQKKTNTTTMFEEQVGYTRHEASHLKLKAFRRLPGDVVWLRFAVQKEL